MIELILDIVLLDRRQLLRRLTRMGLSLLIPLALALVAILWGSVGIFLYVSSLSGPIVAAAGLSVSSLAVALICLFLGMRRHRHGAGGSFADALIGALASRAKDSGTQANDDLAALAILIAAQLDRRAGERS